MSIDGPADVPRVARGRGSITVLHVDDDPDLVELAATFLERHSDALRVLTETSTDGALERLETVEVDCVVSDYDMPGRNGLDLLRAVRERHPELPFILFTGKGSEEIASEAISAGVTDYLRKGSGTDQYAVLANRVENAVTKHDAERMVSRAYSALDTAREGIALLDADGYFRYANQTYADITGYERDALVGEHWELLYPDGHVDRVYDEILPAVPEDGRWNGQTVYERADGEHILTSHALAYTDDGTIICLVQDLSDGRDTSPETAVGDGALEEALDAVDDVVYVLDAEGTVVYANTPTVGEDAEAPLGARALPDLFDPADREAVEEGIQRALETGSDERELRLRAEDGSHRTYEFRSRAVSDETGTPRRIVGVGRDISDRKDRERALNELHRTTRTLMRADSTEEIATLTVEALADILTLTHAAVHRHDPRAEGLVPAAWTSEVESVIGDPPTLGPGSLAWQAFESGESDQYDDLREVDGLHNESTSLRSELIVPLGDHGAVLVASTEPGAFDETDRRLAELLCENATAALERITHETELRRREAELERENERLDEFASLVSHDLRSPLNVANGHLELARAERDSTHLDDAAQALGRMETLIDDVLALAREGEAVDETEPIALSTVVEQCWANVETARADYRLVDDCTVMADESRLARVFENLFRNSVEHGSASNRTQSGDSVEQGSTNGRPESGDHGALTITVGPIDGPDGDPRGFYVEDDGVGISPAERERVFEAGYSTDDGGTGFGLRIVRDIVEAHGWDIACTAAESGGARFEITGVETR
jgi:PAS domain S-box-containing protein